MAVEIKIEAKITVGAVAADGAECAICGDRVYMNARRVFCSINGAAPQAISGLLCWACGDAVEHCEIP